MFVPKISASFDLSGPWPSRAPAGVTFLCHQINPVQFLYLGGDVFATDLKGLGRIDIRAHWLNSSIVRAAGLIVVIVVTPSLRRDMEESHRVLIDAGGCRER